MIARLALAVLVALALPAGADPVSLDRLSAYLNGLKMGQTRFTQFNGDGTTNAGTLFISRPGKMRFEYDPPQEALVLASAGVVAIFDEKSNAEPQQFPLRRTPLNLILGRKIDLSRADMVFDHYETEDGLTVVAARDPKAPETGQIELFFSHDPVALTQWVLTDEAGFTTAVRLEEMDTGVDLPWWIFSVNRETARRGG